MEGEEVKQCVRALGAAHLLGVGWPKEYGGRGFTALEQFIFFEEAQRVNAPIPLVTLNTVGPTLAQCGTDEQKQKVESVEHVLVTSGTGVPTSALILAPAD